MIAGLKPYAEYRDSGLPWLGQVPAHWRVVRNGSLFAQRSQTGFAELPILEVSLKTGVRVRSFGTAKRKQIMSDLGKYKRAAQGDLAYNTMRMWQGALGVCPIDGLVSPAYVVARPHLDVDPRYYAALFRTGDYMAEIDGASRGIVKDRNRLYWEQFKQMRSTCPPLSEQVAIVRFLDWATGRLDRSIRAKRKVIALLLEHEQATTFRMVTRGVDPNVGFKPSGVLWIGDIPESWEIKPLKRLIQRGTTISYGIVQPGDHVEGGVPFLQTTNISKRDLSTHDLQCTTSAIAAAFPRTKLSAGDVVLGIRASIGAAHQVPPALAGVNLSRGVARIVPNAEVSPRYLVQYLRSRATAGYWEFARQGTTFNEVAIASVRALPVVLPPRETQDRILDELRKAQEPVNAAIARVRREIELLREYQDRLAADVVTGRIDVRSIAVDLPAEDTSAFTSEPAHDLEGPDSANEEVIEA